MRGVVGGRSQCDFGRTEPPPPDAPNRRPSSPRPAWQGRHPVPASQAVALARAPTLRCTSPGERAPPRAPAPWIEITERNAYFRCSFDAKRGPDLPPGITGDFMFVRPSSPYEVQGIRTIGAEEDRDDLSKTTLGAPCRPDQALSESVQGSHVAMDVLTFVPPRATCVSWAPSLWAAGLRAGCVGLLTARLGSARKEKWTLGPEGRSHGTSCLLSSGRATSAKAATQNPGSRATCSPEIMNPSNARKSWTHKKCRHEAGMCTCFVMPASSACQAVETVKFPCHFGNC